MYGCLDSAIVRPSRKTEVFDSITRINIVKNNGIVEKLMIKLYGVVSKLSSRNYFFIIQI